MTAKRDGVLNTGGGRVCHRIADPATQAPAAARRPASLPEPLQIPRPDRMLPARELILPCCATGKFLFPTKIRCVQEQN